MSKLIEFYETGDLKKFDEYNKLWIKDTESRVDVVNGFIEVYNDAVGMRGAFESVVSIKDLKYPEDFMRQQMHYAQHYSFLPTYN